MDWPPARAGYVVVTPVIGMHVVCRGLPERVGLRYGPNNTMPPRVAKVVSLDPLRVVLRQGIGTWGRWNHTPRDVAPGRIDREATAREVAIAMVL